MNIYEYLNKIMGLLDSALNNLSQEDFIRLLANVSDLLKDYED